MSQLRLLMMKIRELLRLKCALKLSNRQIARTLKFSPSTVSYYTRASADAGISWPIPEALDGIALWARIAPYCEQIKTSPRSQWVVPDWLVVYNESSKTVQNRFSHLRTFSKWINKPGSIKPVEHYLDMPLKHTEKPETGRSWVDQGAGCN